MPPGLPPGTMTTPRLPGAVPLPGSHLPLLAVFRVAVILRSEAGSGVEAVVEDPQGKLAVARRERKQVLVHILEQKHTTHI